MKNELEPHIEEMLKELEKEISQIQLNENSEESIELLKVIEEINNKENKLDELINQTNELQELENQLRHVKKTSEAYNIKEYEEKLNMKYKTINSEILKKKIKQLAKVLIILDEKERISLWEHIVSIFILRKKLKQIEKDGILMHLLLEECYLTELIEERKSKLESENFEELKIDINELYMQRCLPISNIILNKTIKKEINMQLVNKTLEKIQLAKKETPTKENPTPIVSSIKNELLQIYPVVLTTVDSVISNYSSYFKCDSKVDYVIIDEASQCDILSALPLLYLAKNIMVVGDEKQLSAITNIKIEKLKNMVQDEYDYTKENFLSSISKTIKPISKMLMEHYRCDYNIINYCNKFFYENKLKIYNDAKKGAMSLINNNKGKYVEHDQKSYKNEREIKCINEQIQDDITNKFIITPFKRTSEHIKK